MPTIRAATPSQVVPVGSLVTTSGDMGTDGKSAFECAQDGGFEGTLQEWLDGLKGDPGIDGKSAFEIAEDNGFAGTEETWLDSLKGQDGDDGPPGPTEVSTDPGNMASIGDDGYVFVARETLATTSKTGLLRTLSGNAGDYLNGSGQWQNLSNAIQSLIVSLGITVPTGTILDFGGSTAPNGYLLCNGASYLRTAQPALFAVVGTTYGSSSGTTFNVPDSRGRGSIGAGNGVGLTNRALGATGGEENHVLTVAELATHGHTVTIVGGDHAHMVPAHNHYSTVYYWYYGFAQGGYLAYWLATYGTAYNMWNISTAPAVATDSRAPAYTGTISATGSSVGHNTMSPFITFNKIIKT